MLARNVVAWVKLLNTLLMPKWTYRTLFLPNDTTFKVVNTMSLGFVLSPEGMERTKTDTCSLEASTEDCRTIRCTDQVDLSQPILAQKHHVQGGQHYVPGVRPIG